MNVLCGLTLIALCNVGLAANPELERAARKRGMSILSSTSTDFERDGFKEEVVAASKDFGIVLSVWRKVGDNPYNMLFESQVYDGQVVLQLQARQLVADATPEVIFETREVTPDETTRRLIVSRYHQGRLVPIYSSLFPVGPIPRIGPGTDLLAFGEVSAGYRFVDVDNDGIFELAVRRDLKTIKAQQPSRSGLLVVLGSNESIMTFDEKVGVAGEFSAGRERYFPYLVEVAAAKVSASSQALPPHLESMYGRAAVEKGVKDVFATALDGKEAPETTDDSKTPSLERDPAPMAKWAADASYETEWCEGVEGVGVGESWQADFATPTKLRMLSIVLGDARSERAHFRRNDVRRFKLIFSNGDVVIVDRSDQSRSSGPLAGNVDFALKGGKGGAQTLVFLSKPIEASWIRIEFDDVRVRGSKSESCISEVVFYANRPST